MYKLTAMRFFRLKLIHRNLSHFCCLSTEQLINVNKCVQASRNVPAIERNWFPTCHGPAVPIRPPQT